MDGDSTSARRRNRRALIGQRVFWLLPLASQHCHQFDFHSTFSADTFVVLCIIHECV
jgi:hypothetical protein